MDYSWLILTKERSAAEISFSEGSLRDEWEKLKEMMVDGDQIWEYECSLDDRNPLAGSFGYCLKRGDKVLAHIVTRRVFFR